MPRHGDEAHFIRPDGVYITSELQPAVGAGFNPVADTMAVAARFVAPTGLAGPVGTVHLLGEPTPRAAVRGWWTAFRARIKANMAANKFFQDMRIRPVRVNNGGGRMTLDTSPRPAPPSPTALEVQGGYAPAPQSPSTAANYQPLPGDPNNNNAVVTAVNLTPGQAATPIAFWQGVQRGLHPVVAARAQEDALTRWFGVKHPTDGGW